METTMILVLAGSVVLILAMVTVALTRHHKQQETERYEKWTSVAKLYNGRWTKHKSSWWRGRTTGIEVTVRGRAIYLDTCMKRIHVHGQSASVPFSRARTAYPVPVGPNYYWRQIPEIEMASWSEMFKESKNPRLHSSDDGINGLIPIGSGDESTSVSEALQRLVAHTFDDRVVIVESNRKGFSVMVSGSLDSAETIETMLQITGALGDFDLCGLSYLRELPETEYHEAQGPWDARKPPRLVARRHGVEISLQTMLAAGKWKGTTPALVATTNNAWQVGPFCALIGTNELPNRLQRPEIIKRIEVLEHCRIQAAPALITLQFPTRTPNIETVEHGLALLTTLAHQTNQGPFR